MIAISHLAAPAERLRGALNALSSVLALFFRLYVGQAFFLSGLTKIRDWDSTLFLFQEEYHVPVLPPEVAACMGAAGELILPVFLVLGLAGRFGAIGLTVVNIVAVISYPGLAAAALKDHYIWGAMLLVILFYGPGKLSLDAVIWPRLSGRSGQS
jgi:putative oxidoreductase